MNKILIALIVLLILAMPIAMPKEPVTQDICHNYWWFDASSKYCSYGEFCGKYMYYGLYTFETKKECKKELKIEKRKK